MLMATQKMALDKPQLFWRWLTEAAVIAKHKLGDIDLALQLARDVKAQTKRGQVPNWAHDMELLLLADLGEYQTALVLVTSLLESGTIFDNDEKRFLLEKLELLRQKSVEK